MGMMIEVTTNYSKQMALKAEYNVLLSTNALTSEDEKNKIERLKEIKSEMQKLRDLHFKTFTEII